MEEPSFLSYLKTLSNGPAPGIESPTSALQSSAPPTELNPAAVKNREESFSPTFGKWEGGYTAQAYLSVFLSFLPVSVHCSKFQRFI